MNTPVNFEIAKLLKEKGFDKRVKGFYDIEKELHINYVDEMNTKGFANRHLPKGECSAPTIAEVVMWLYEKHGIWIEANFLPNVDKFSYIAKPMDFKKPKEFPSYKDYCAASSKFIAKNKYNSPTEAYEAAIEYTLENIK